MFSKIKSRFNRNTYKLYVIIVFTLAAITLVIVSSRVSYYFIKDLYLEQLDEHVKSLSFFVGKQIDEMYISTLDFGAPAPAIKNYFSGYFTENLTDEEAFIFDRNSNVLIHSDPKKITPFNDSRLLLNKTEINSLNIKSTEASMSFKGNDGQWYMWGFYRLNDNYFLAIKVSADKLEKVEDFSLFFWYLGFAGIFVTALAGWYVAGKISRPIKSLADFSRKIGAGQLNAILEGKAKGELKNLYDALDKMRKGLIQIQKEKEDMLAQIAHEIRNPLGVIELMASLVKEDLTEENRNTEYIDKIIKETTTLKNLITSYLNFSKPVAAVKEWVTLDELFQEIKDIFSKKLQKKKINVMLNNSINKIYFDKNHLRNILINLVANSIDAFEKPGKIILSSGLTNGKWKISVTDNGMGIRNENKEKLFTPFFTTKKNGTGLGLAISKKLCEENNALLSLSHSINGETKFTIEKLIEHE